MCGRYTIRRLDLFIRAGAMDPAPFEEFDERRIVPRFNVAPSQQVPVVRLTKEGHRRLQPMQWGLIPSWAAAIPKVKPINARAETVPTSGMFRQAFAQRRCLVAADGFYEWQKIDAKTKQPMFIHFHDDRPFAFAGLWERWRPPDADPIDTCTIITTEANQLMAPIHNRMPVILAAEDYSKWLDRDTDLREAAGLLRPYPDRDLEAIRVGTRVNNPRNDVPDNIAPLNSA